MKKKRKSLYQRFLTVFGDLKVFGWPMFLLYQPTSYKVKGEDIREVLDTIRPGDILVRGYRNYLDGYFIPGYFSHVGLFLGEVVDADCPQVESLAQSMGKDARFKTGKQMMIHALAEGVILEDVINFCRCDFMAVLRFPEVLAGDQAAAAMFPDDVFSDRERAMLKRVQGAAPVPFSDVFPIIKDAVLGKLGTEYDFSFDFSRFETLSCSELVYFATKCVSPFLKIQAENRRVMLLKRSLILPDAFVRSGLELVWQSRSVDEAALKALRPQAPAAPQPASGNGSGVRKKIEALPRKDDQANRDKENLHV